MPIISEALLTKGMNKIGKPKLSNLISSSSSRLFTWSKKFIPAIIGQYGIFDEFSAVFQKQIIRCAE